MREAIRFETPENIQVAYLSAGLGTRFYAWVIDQVLVTVVLVVLFFVSIMLLALFDGAAETAEEYLSPFQIDEDDFDPNQVGLFIIGLFYLFYGLGSMVYFGFSELVMRGQTFGKRSAKIRVVKIDGFALDAPSVFLRNVFRVFDQVPLMWLVPVFSARAQRLGDMAAATIVVSEGETHLSPIRAALAERTAENADFRFDATALSKLRQQDAEAIELLLERWSALDATTSSSLVETVTDSLADRLGVDSPPPQPAQRRLFLEDLLAAEYRRRNRAL